MKTDDAAELAQTLFEEMGDAAFIVDPETMGLLDVNPMAERLTGLSRAELRALSLHELLRPDTSDSLAHLRHALRTTMTFHSQEGYSLRQGAGGWAPVNLTLTRLHTEQRLLGLVLARDVSPQHEARQKLQRANAELEHRVRERTADLAIVNETLRAEIAEHRQDAAALHLRDRAIQAASQGILITDPNQPDNPILFANHGFERITGYRADEVIGRSYRFLLGRETDPQAVGRLQDAVQDGRECSVEILNYRKDGTPFWNALSVTPVEEQGRPRTFVGVMTDVTERRRLEDRLRQAQKMEAVGQLAGGVAHDFNNLLTVIAGYSDLLLARLAPSDPMCEPVKAIHEAGGRAASLTRQLLAFSRRSVLDPKVLDMNAVVRDTGKLLTRLIGEDVRIATIAGADLGRVLVDPGQLEQVLMNLAVNARDAMPRGGSLTIETRNVTPDEVRAARHDEVPPGRYVLLAVSDTGCGMSAEVKAHIFEPFFTTKPVGQGTGLGLAVVDGIVRQSGGHIEVDSEPGLGTIFRLHFPAVETQPATQARPAPDTAAQGTETVLLVEDEEGVRRLTLHVLQTCGYKVLAANDGKEAMTLIDQYPGPIDLLLTDVVMPGMDGRELAEAVRRRLPGTKVLYLSGYTDDVVVRRGISHDDVAFLPKPFSPLSLARKVREVLDRTD